MLEREVRGKLGRDFYGADQVEARVGGDSLGESPAAGKILNSGDRQSSGAVLKDVNGAA